MTRPSLSRLALRGLLAGALAGAVGALALGSQAGAQAIAGFNSDQPVNYAADRIELQDKQQRVVLSGNVVVDQGDLRLTAARTTVAYTNDGGLKIQRIDATGGVVVTRGNERASGSAGVYDFNRRVIVLSAGPGTHPIGEFVINLPRPRDVSEIRLTPEFVRLHDEIWHTMKEEVLKGYVQSQNK